MDNRLIFRYHMNGAKGGRTLEDQPLDGVRCQVLISEEGDREIRCRSERDEGGPTGQKWLERGPRKASK